MENASQVSEKVQAMQTFRETLPAYKLKEEFLETVFKNQVQIHDLLSLQ